MKKILCILFCLLPVLGGKAQTLYRDQVRIEKESLLQSCRHPHSVPRIKWPHQDTTFHRSLRSQT